MNPTNTANNYQFAIAITGSIASGKSTALNYFKKQGFQTIDADKIAHIKLVEQSQTVKKLFPSIVENNTVNRGKLGEIIFSDKVAKNALEQLLHPLIRKEINQQSRWLESLKKIYFIDIPLFFETQQYSIKHSLLISCNKTLQLARLIKRNQFTQQQAQQRINAQMSLCQKMALAEYTINNDESKEKLFQECQKYLQWIKTQIPFNQTNSQ